MTTLSTLFLYWKDLWSMPFLCLLLSNFQASQLRPRNMLSPPRPPCWPGREAQHQTRRKRKSWRPWSCSTTLWECLGSSKTNILFPADSGGGGHRPPMPEGFFHNRRVGNGSKELRLHSNSQTLPNPLSVKAPPFIHWSSDMSGGNDPTTDAFFPHFLSLPCNFHNRWGCVGW